MHLLYSVFGYPIHPQDTSATNNLYNAYGGKQFPFYYPAAASGSPGVYLNYYPFYAQHGQNSPALLPQSDTELSSIQRFWDLIESHFSFLTIKYQSSRSKTCSDSRTAAMRVPIALSEQKSWGYFL
ncbi:RNA-BINDING PROTEIN ARP1 ISOFORM X1-RELATED [Salix koriyanagi]|uniref:RNA-BINDING PROTEIN ARP1 ISOFORM X1-RELATED n=1 Tax=Salix koriyanagi TaxID=2511006 RepID=A0A9Q0PGM5_9ROSI|nr:RNA-BINDING PROTEIN ARP1 ISOFORM X1-RELATED [Salix koriyanagi]